MEVGNGEWKVGGRHNGTARHETDRSDRQAAVLLLEANYVVGMTGAGISVESGIPPFRGPGGLWTKYGEPPMNGYERFLENPTQAWTERLAPTGASKEIQETIRRAQPNPGHHALVQMEETGLLRYLITQNVDNLHRRAGSQKLAEIHGNSTLVRCIQCAPGRRSQTCPSIGCRHRARVAVAC